MTEHNLQQSLMHRMSVTITASCGMLGKVASQACMQAHALLYIVLAVHQQEDLAKNGANYQCQAQRRTGKTGCRSVTAASAAAAARAGCPPGAAGPWRSACSGAAPPARSQSPGRAAPAARARRPGCSARRCSAARAPRTAGTRPAQPHSPQTCAKQMHRVRVSALHVGQWRTLKLQLRASRHQI